MTTRLYPPIHPGEILREEFLEPLGITPYRLAQATGLSQTAISQILRGKRSITPATGEAAFGSLAGVNPIPASSGNTVRHRLNRRGDRRLNRALHMAVVTRMTYDPPTRAYVERRTAEGLSRKEIRRILKRYLARQIYRAPTAAARASNSVTEATLDPA